MPNHTKIYTGFFILCVVLGAKVEDIFNLLRDNIGDTPLFFKDGILTVKINSEPYAKKVNSDFLANSDDKLTFALPHTVNMLISKMKRDLSSIELEEKDFFDGYKHFIKDSTKSFSKSILIKPKRVHRYLARYLQDMSADTLTGLLATATVSQNDNAKAGYVSTRSKPTLHAQLINQFCIDLGTDEVISSLLGISNVFQTTISTIEENNFAGSSRVVDVYKAREFFKTLRLNIMAYIDESELHFNLVSIYIRYAMSLLLGTRSFNNSAKFSSFSHAYGLWYINEKSQDIATGVRVVPVCNLMKILFKQYEDLLNKRGLEYNCYLVSEGSSVLFTASRAFQIVRTHPYLDNHGILERYITDVPLNSGRHLFTRKAIDFAIDTYYISTYLGHYAMGEEQFGLYSTLNVENYCDTVNHITAIIANEYGIKELS